MSLRITQSPRYHVIITVILRCYHVVITALSRRYHGVITRISRRYRIVIIVLSSRYHSAITSLSHRYHSAMNDENKLAKELVEVHEVEEGARRAEAATIVKHQEAQSAMETADLATYRAAMALRIAAQKTVAAGGESIVDCL